MITKPGQTIPPSEDQLEKDSVRLLGEMRQAMEHDRHRTFANCWHANSVESEALWRLYSPPPHPRGMIQTTAEALEASLGPDVDVEIAHVQYLDFTTALAGPYERNLTKAKTPHHRAKRGA